MRKAPDLKTYVVLGILVVCLHKSFLIKRLNKHGQK